MEMSTNIEPQAKDSRGKALSALILGIISIPTALLPILGLPIGVIGLVLGIISRKSSSKGKAVVGIVLSIIGLVLTIINAGIGVYMAINGLHPLVNWWEG